MCPICHMLNFPFTPRLTALNFLSRLRHFSLSYGIFTTLYSTKRDKFRPRTELFPPHRRVRVVSTHNAAMSAATYLLAGEDWDDPESALSLRMSLGTLWWLWKIQELQSWMFPNNVTRTITVHGTLHWYMCMSMSAESPYVKICRFPERKPVSSLKTPTWFTFFSMIVVQ